MSPVQQLAGTLQSNDLARVRELLEELARPDILRGREAASAPLAVLFEQRGLQGVTDGTSAVVTGTEIYRIPEAANKKFFQLVMTFDAGSGAGRYKIDGQDPTASRGVPVPSGGTVLIITGADNIKNFALMAEAANSLSFARYLFV